MSGEKDPLEDSLQPFYNQGHYNGPIVVDDWAGGIAENRAQFPSVRLRRRWFSTLWLVPLGILALVVSIAVVRQLSNQQWYQDFTYQYPVRPATM